ncbi:hypothetical protein MNBD_GAMMA23-1737 [hydrothermal vent metagenome]|uniref:Uncharacterized protein n=1 Tax=hydrothermal vent metagenome TaxID=652676 RepID=A0A3B0ZRZ1_9ZZZZ
MSEVRTGSFTSLIVVSEIAALLAVILIVAFVLSLRKQSKKKKLSESFLTAVKSYEIERDKTLKVRFSATTDLGEDERNKLVDTLIESEKKVYLHIAQLYMGYNPESILDLEKEMQSLAECSLNIYSQQSDSSTTDEADDSGSHDLKKQIKNLRDEKKELKEKNAQLQIDFDAAMDSMERMTTEFANMYEGGSKEGEKRVKNEMYQLRQTLAQKKEFTEASDDEKDEGDEVPDMEVTPESKEGGGKPA